MRSDVLSLLIWAVTPRSYEGKFIQGTTNGDVKYHEDKMEFVDSRRKGKKWQRNEKTNNQSTENNLP